MDLLVDGKEEASIQNNQNPATSLIGGSYGGGRREIMVKN